MTHDIGAHDNCRFHLLMLFLIDFDDFFDDDSLPLARMKHVETVYIVQ